MGLFSRTARDATDTSNISFTALYTGYVWYLNGLSSESFRTRRGAYYYNLMRPLDATSWKLLDVSVRDFLLQRHVVMDDIINRLIEQENVTQVLEIACGLSPRGWRYTKKYPQLKYVEADLPDMAARKAALLKKLNEHDALNKRHFVTTCNILTDGDDSLASVIAREFDTSKPLLVITEGLINYFDLGTVSEFWLRLQNELAKFPLGIYLTDNYPLGTRPAFRPIMKLAGGTLARISRSRFAFHFENDTQMKEHFIDQGFRAVTVHNPRDYYGKLTMPQTRGDSMVRVIEARTRARQ